MVLLTATPAAKLATKEFCRLKGKSGEDEAEPGRLETLAAKEAGSPIDHKDLIVISNHLVQYSRLNGDIDKGRQWRLDTLLKGAAVYQPPPPPKKEPTPEYKALMQRLRAQEEQRQYERMSNPSAPQVESFKQRFPNSPYDFNPATSHGYTSTAQEDKEEVTFADVNRQMILIINVLVSIVACSIAIWIAARRWSVPQRLALSLSGSGVVAVAEVAIYFGYIKRIEDAKATEVKAVEKKEIVETWVIDKTNSSKEVEVVRLRKVKGKNR